MSKILLAAGGTGGHMFPAISVSEQLQARAHEVYFVTDERGAKYLPEECSKSVYNLSRLGNRTLVSMPLAIWQMFVVIVSCFFLFLFSRPARVVGFGGYVTYPVLLMARIFMVPYYIHEQNSVMGNVNRWFLKGAKGVMTSFPDTLYANDAALYTGLPVRKDLLVVRESPPYLPPVSNFNLLVLGGSQGASVFSNVVPQALNLLPKELKQQLSVVQQCRPNDLDAVQEMYREMNVRARLAPFFDRMAIELSHAHLVICRSGASTVAELGIIGRPAIFVPYPAAMDDHQVGNASYAVSQGGGWMMLEKDFTPEALAKLLQELWHAPALLEQSARMMRALGKCSAAEEISQVILS